MSSPDPPKAEEPRTDPPKTEEPKTEEPKTGIPLYVRVLIGAGAGAILGVIFGTGPLLFGLKNEHLGQLGILVIKLLKALAVPLIFVSIVDAFVRTRFSARQGAKLLLICGGNVLVAMAIGLSIMNLVVPGKSWTGHLNELVARVPQTTAVESILHDSKKGSLSPIDNISSYVPRSLVEPFHDNNVIAVVLCALLAGAALRQLRESAPGGSAEPEVTAIERAVFGALRVLVQMLSWVVALVPFAVFGVVAQIVGKAGIGVFSVVWVFLVTILAGLVVHSLVYYPLVVWLLSRRTPRHFLGRGADAIVTGLSCNSSLATVPITLRCLAAMGVSPRSSRLAACVGTNFNNDGITLYEAMAAIFLVQAVGGDLGLSKQMTIVISSILAGAGIAGIPEAGLIVLPLVLAAAGLSEAVIAAALPLILTVDWIIARARSGVNVMSDMVVAILLDVGTKTEPPEESTAIT